MSMSDTEVGGGLLIPSGSLCHQQRREIPLSRISFGALKDPVLMSDVDGGTFPVQDSHD